MSTLKAIRGTRDLLPPETEIWNHVEATARRVFARYNFGEIRTPVFEDTSLFARGVGEETDIVTKEMFTWEDGERFNEKKLIDDWIKANLSTDPGHAQADRILRQGTALTLSWLRKLGVQEQVWRGIRVGPHLLTGHV